MRWLSTTLPNAMMARPMLLPMSIAAMPSVNPTSSTVDPPVRNAQVAIARLMVTQLKSPAPQTRSFLVSGSAP